MSERTEALEHPPAWGVVLGTLSAWSAFAVVKILGRVLTRSGLDVAHSVMHELTYVCVNTVISVPLFLFAQRYPLVAGRWRARVPLLLVVVLGGAVIASFARNVIWMGFAEATSVPVITEAWHVDVLIMILVVGLAHVDVYVRAQRREAIAAGRLDAQLAEARLRALQAQIHPHFLFNTLHTVAQLAKTGRVTESVRVVELLGDLLRRSLDDPAGLLVPLREEIELARSYLEIEQVRFADRLFVTWEIDEERTSEALLPPFAVQPLIENAVQHGLTPSAAAFHLNIAARKRGDMLVIEVSDDGVGLRTEPTRPGGGLGIPNTRERLEVAFGSNATLTVANRSDHGVIATIVIPFIVDPKASAIS